MAPPLQELPELHWQVLQALSYKPFKKRDLRLHLNEQLLCRARVNLLARGLDNRGVVLPSHVYARIYRLLLA